MAFHASQKERLALPCAAKHKIARENGGKGHVFVYNLYNSAFTNGVDGLAIHHGKTWRILLVLPTLHRAGVWVPF
jgi:hypothetical protein